MSVQARAAGAARLSRRGALLAAPLLVVLACGEPRRTRRRASDEGGASGHGGPSLPLGVPSLLDKGVTYAVEGTGIFVKNLGRGMTIESEGGHHITATLEVSSGGAHASLDLKGWTPKTFAGYTFAITGMGEKYGGSDVKVRIWKAD